MTRYWLLLALGMVAFLVLVPGLAEAHHGGGFYWQGWWGWNGQWCSGLFNSAHELVYYHCR